MDPSRPALNVAMVGHAFMGNAHSQAWRVELLAGWRFTPSLAC